MLIRVTCPKRSRLIVNGWACESSVRDALGGRSRELDAPPRKRKVRLARAGPRHGYRGQRLVSFLVSFM